MTKPMMPVQQVKVHISYCPAKLGECNQPLYNLFMFLFF